MTAGPTFAQRATAEKKRFLELLRDPAGTQERLLLRYVSANRDTAFGREHDFSRIRTLSEYRRAVPVRTYSELVPWIDRVVAGERNVLTESMPVLFMETTGTTGKPKTLPVTREYLRNSISNMLVYWASFLEHFPEVADRDDSVVMLYLAPKPFSKWTPGGVPIHNPTHLPADIKSGFPFARAPWFPPPSELTDAERLYYLVRKSVQSPVLALSCLHPSRLQSLVLLLQSQASRLVKEVHDGTVLEQPGAEPDPQRARELAALVDASAVTPRAIWPTLKVVSCWTGGSFKMYLPEIREQFGAEIYPQTSSSSEAGHITVPIDHREQDGPLTIGSNFYEFRPEGGRGDDDTRGAAELEVGATYEILLSTCSGLHRYAGGDLFRVIDLSHGVPCLEFVGREGVSDMTGEKVTEQHVMAAIERALAACQVKVTNATCCAVWGKPSRYVFVFEPSAEWPEDAALRVAQALDASLVEQNSRYELKREFGDLGAAAVDVVARGTFGRYRDQLTARGMSATQLKEKMLHIEGAAVLAALRELRS